MKIKETGFSGLLLVLPDVLNDERGYFFESFHKEKFRELGLPTEFLQDNQSLSHKNVLRGLHFQNPPFDQGKLVRVVSGSLLDVVVDIRKKSPTYGRSFSIELNAKEPVMLWIPPGFAHGFLALENNTILNYKCSKVYNHQSESGLYYNDKDLNISWNCSSPIVSEKDKLLTSFKDFNTSF
jgi:dTDP-4-dehydrorhamnose 3,5-epimerase